MSDEKNQSQNDNNNSQEKFKPNKDRKVLVTSKTLFNEKVVVVYQRIKPQLGPLREQFNIYEFNNDGEAVMIERDAILFLKDRESKEPFIGDTKVFSLDKEFEYDLEKMKDVYKIEKKDKLDDSSSE